MTLPLISVNIPLITGGDASSVLARLKEVQYPHELVEVLIIEGNQIARQRNRGVRHSKGDIIYLLDNDSLVQPNAFKILVKEFKNKKVAAVGGPSLTPKSCNNYLSVIIGYALETYFGALRMRFRYSQQKKRHNNESEYQLIGANLALRRIVVKRLKGFNENIVPNEETELLRRIKQKGYRLKYNDKLFIYRDQRKTVHDLIKQFFRYGVGRTKQILYEPKVEDIIFAAPIGFLFYLLSLIVYHHAYYFICLGIYLGVSLATTIKAALKYRRIDVVISLPIIFFIIHISYAVGLIVEFLFHYVPKKKKVTKNKMNVRRINLWS